jgi:hypothetical protein
VDYALVLAMQPSNTSVQSVQQRVLAVNT